MDRLQAFEAMLADVQHDADLKKAEIEKLKKQGKERSATFKQYLADRLFYQRMLALYEKYDLL